MKQFLQLRVDIPPKIFLITDFIQTIPKMLLFSETFINKLADKLKNELDFFPAKLRIKNDEFKFFPWKN